MVQVKIKETFLVEATGVTYTKGETVEVSDELAKRHGANGTGMLEVVKPIKK